MSGLTLDVKHRGPGDNRYSWRPFADSPNFNPGWWNGSAYPYSWVAQALLSGDEVARFELNPDVHISGYHPPPATVPDLEITRFEVSVPHRRGGIGRSAIQALTDLYPDHRFVAYSEDADRFWAAIGWQCIVHPGDDRARPLFVQPERST